MNNAEWFAAHVKDYADALVSPVATAEYLAQQLAELRELAAYLIGETL